MKEFSKITDYADSLTVSIFMAEENFSSMLQQQLEQMYAHARPAIHAETDGFLEPSVSAPINYSFKVFYN